MKIFDDLHLGERTILNGALRFNVYFYRCCRLWLGILLGVLLFPFLFPALLYTKIKRNDWGG
jgi:hypothetical protein